MSITIQDKIKYAHTDTIANFRLDYVCVYIRRTQQKIKDWTMFVCTIGQVQNMQTYTTANYRLDYVCVYIRRTQLKIKDWTIFVCILGQVQNMQTDKTENYNRLDYVCVHQDKIKYEGGHNCKLYRLDYVCVYFRRTQLKIKDWTIFVCILGQVQNMQTDTTANYRLDYVCVHQDKIKYAGGHNCKL